MNANTTNLQRCSLKSGCLELVCFNVRLFHLVYYCLLNVISVISCAFTLLWFYHLGSEVDFLMSRRIQCVYLVCLQQYAPCLLQYCTGAGECVKLICVSAAGRDLFSRTILESYDTSSAVQVEQVAPMVETIGPLLAVDSSICARNVSVLIRSPS